MKKREFIKYCAYGIGSAACGVNPLSNLLADGTSINKWTKEAQFYEKKGKTNYCTLCPIDCIVRPGKIGDCRVRENIDGKLYSLVYGNPCAVHIDPIEKKPLYHFLPESKAFSIATAGCNLRCLNCQNWSISQSSPDDTKNYDLLPDELIKSCLNYQCDSIAYTYSEPIVFYEYMYDSAVLAHKNNIKNLMITAGYIYEKPIRKLCKVIDAANVDLKSFKEETYKKLNRGTLKPVLKTLEIMKEEGVWIEITNLIVPNWTDDLKMIKEMCRWLVKNDFKNTPLHFSRFSPMYKLKHLPMTPVKTLSKAYEIAKDAGLSYVYIGNVPGSGKESTYCPGCGKTVIERKGYYIGEKNLKNGSCVHCGQKIHGVWK